MIDTHCHIFAEEFNDDREDVISRAQVAGVQKIIMPNIDSSTTDVLKAVGKQHPSYCYAMMGLHPCSVKQNYHQELERIESELLSGEYVGVGEIGLDYYWDTTFQKEQKDAFRRQLQIAKEKKLPVAIHTRISFEDALQIVNEEQDGTLTGVFHCFTGTIEDANRIADAGMMLGIGGVSTFKNGGLDKVLPYVDLENILLETDSPYLAPVPFRGKRNEPSYLAFIASRLADIKNVKIEIIKTQTTKNALRLFNIS
jgi:TatD DNase family protein